MARSVETIKMSRYIPYKQVDDDPRQKVKVVDLGHVAHPKRVLCPLHINKPVMDYHEDKKFYHCKSCGNIINPEEDRKPLLHEDEQFTFITDPYHSRNIRIGGQSATKVAYGLEPRISAGGTQTIENLKSDKKTTYNSLEEAAQD
jgi:hypothetical protein